MKETELLYEANTYSDITFVGTFIIYDTRNAQHAQSDTGIQTSVDNPFAPVGDWQTATPQEVGMDPVLFAIGYGHAAFSCSRN